MKFMASFVCQMNRPIHLVCRNGSVFGNTRKLMLSSFATGICISEKFLVAVIRVFSQYAFEFQVILPQDVS